jgi:hypothetical protein
MSARMCTAPSIETAVPSVRVLYELRKHVRRAARKRSRLSPLSGRGSEQLRAAEVPATQYGDQEGSKTGVKLASRLRPCGDTDS